MLIYKKNTDVFEHLCSGMKHFSLLDVTYAQTWYMMYMRADYNLIFYLVHHYFTQHQFAPASAFWGLGILTLCQNNT